MKKIEIVSRDIAAHVKDFRRRSAKTWYWTHVESFGHHGEAIKRLKKLTHDLAGRTEEGSWMVEPKAFGDGAEVTAWGLIIRDWRKKWPWALVVYRNRAYAVYEPFPDDELALLVKHEDSKLGRSLKKIRAVVEASDVGWKAGYRERIPKDVQQFVWNRDKGRCVECGIQKNLEFDHIIPVAKGGSSTARNVQILCEACNARKGTRVG